MGIMALVDIPVGNHITVPVVSFRTAAAARGTLAGMSIIGLNTSIIA